jgi:hypothetical protein
MAAANAPLTQVTQRVRAMRKAGDSERRIAAALGSTRNVVHTILTKGAAVTRGKAKQALLRWASRNGAAPADAARASAAKPTSGSSHSEPKRRRRRRGARRRTPTLVATHQGAHSATQSGFATLETEHGHVLRLSIGARYVFRNGALYREVA